MKYPKINPLLVYILGINIKYTTLEGVRIWMSTLNQSMLLGHVCYAFIGNLLKAHEIP
jgi:hypothetical protein